MIHQKMNKLIIAIAFILLNLHSIRTENQLPKFDLQINKTVYLVGDRIVVDVLVSNLPENRNVTVTVKGKSNKNPNNLLACIDCSTRFFIGKRLRSSILPKPSNHLDHYTNEQIIDSPHEITKRETIDNVQVLRFKWKAIEASKLTLFIETNLTRDEIDKNGKMFAEIGIIKSRNWSILADIVGWSYFVFWLLCFYPQLFLNWKRKSCVGLSLDYCVLNFVGFLFYAIFNLSIYFVDIVQAEYAKVYPYSNIPVLTNDLVFSLHHLIVSGIIAIQCIFIYENGNQSLSQSCIVSLTTIFSGFFILGYYVLEGKFNLLDYVYYFGFVKMFFTALKYVPQAYSNFKKKSTIGWSFSFNIYDMLGGTSCLIQMFILIHNYQDWSFISKNVAKTGIALLTLVFDIVFVIQHCIYGEKSQLNKNKMNGYGATKVSCSKLDDNDKILFKEHNSAV